MAQTDYYGTQARRSRFWPVVMLLIAFLLGIAATAYAVHNMSSLARLIHPAATVPAVATPASSPQRLIVQPAPPPSDAALNERVATLESRLDTIEAREAEATGDADRAEGLLVAFATRRALDRGQPLGYIEGLLREKFGGSDAASVAQIIAASQRPVTLVQLRDGLDTLRPALVARSTDRAWWQGIGQEFSSLFVVRRANQPSNVPTDRLARAEHALEQGQVDDAAAEIARMPGAARANDWLAQARRYMLARNALDRIETAALLKPAPPKAVLPTPID